MRNRCKTLLREHSIPQVILQACVKHIQSQPYLRPSPLEDLKDLPSNPKFKILLCAVSKKISEESKIVHKTIQRAYALKSKGCKKRSALQRIVSNIRSKYFISQVQAITGMTYRQVYRLIGPPKMSSSKWLVTDNDHLSICNIVDLLKTTHSMTIPYRCFNKYLCLRDLIHATYLAYVKEQKWLGARILKESTWYKYLPKNVHS